MRSMDSYSKAAMERTMKIQEVLLRAMARKITWFQAAEILGFTDRHVRRIRLGEQALTSQSLPAVARVGNGSKAVREFPMWH
jgi:hypothetical protein